MRMKRGVVLMGSEPCIFNMIEAAESFYFDYEIEGVITSGCEGTHSPNSKHYKGRALDFRTRDMTEEQKLEFAQDMRTYLGGKYDVVLEPTHLHVEYDPK